MGSFLGQSERHAIQFDSAWHDNLYPDEVLGPVIIKENPRGSLNLFRFMDPDTKTINESHVNWFHGFIL